MPEFEFLWPQGPKLRQLEGAYPLSTDSVLLWHFVRASRARRLMDLGAGGGVLMVLIGSENPACKLEGIEINPKAVQAAQVNLELNALTGSVSLGDIRDHRKLFTAGAYDLVVSNPPYFERGRGYASPEAHRRCAREEQSCTLEDLCTAAGYLCKWGGRFTMVHRPERLSQIFSSMTKAGIEPKRLRMVHSRSDAAPSLLLIEGKKGAKPGLSIEPNLVLHKQDGSYTKEHREIYRMQT